MSRGSELNMKSDAIFQNKTPKNDFKLNTDILAHLIQWDNRESVTAGRLKSGMQISRRLSTMGLSQHCSGTFACSPAILWTAMTLIGHVEVGSENSEGGPMYDFLRYRRRSPSHFVMCRAGSDWRRTTEAVRATLTGDDTMGGGGD